MFYVPSIGSLDRERGRESRRKNGVKVVCQIHTLAKHVVFLSP